MKFNKSRRRWAQGLLFTLAALFTTLSLADEHQMAMDTQPCPADFYSVPLIPAAKLCQVFAQGLPASMTYHATTDLQAARTFYIEQAGQMATVKDIKGRVVVEFDDSNKIVILSQDGAGTQIDVLVKS